jgi:hypothetical protein
MEMTDTVIQCSSGVIAGVIADIIFYGLDSKIYHLVCCVALLELSLFDNHTT